MSFSFSTPFNDISRVRFYIGDVSADRAIFQDEVIVAVIAQTGTWQTAVIACIQNIISQLSSQSDFKADWLSVDYKTALQYWQNQLNLLARQLGVPNGRIVATATYLWRPDSNQQGEPTYPKNMS